MPCLIIGSRGDNIALTVSLDRFLRRPLLEERLDKTPSSEVAKCHPGPRMLRLMLQNKKVLPR